MASYTRQSSFSDGDTISASLFNNEYNQLVTAFSYASSGTTGHRHDGTAGEGGNIHTIGDQDFLNKIVVDSTNNRWGFYVQVSSSAVEQIRIQDGAIVPVTSNDIDLGTSSLEFKDLYIDGTASIDSLTLTSGATVTVIFDEDDMFSDSATGLATQQSIKAYVDSQFTGQTLEFSGDSGGTLSIDLDSETLTLTGGTGIDTTGSVNDLTIAIDSTVVTLTGSQTLTNKTLTTPVISSISNTGTLTLPTSTDTLVGRATTDTLTNKTISSASNTITVNLGSATVTGTLAQFNTALSDGSFVSLAGSETLTNKTLTSPTLTSPVITTPQINDTSADHQYVFAVSELAADRTVTLPLLTGNDTFVFESHTQTLTNKTLTTPVISSISNSGTVTLPTGTTTLVGTDTADVLTNKTISGASNTLSNIGNSSLSNSSVSFGGVSVSLGSSDATPAFDLSDATGYTGDSNLVTTGTISSGVWQGTAVADAYVANDLTISGGTVDNTVVGGTTAAAGTFTSLNVTGDLTVSGTTTTVNSTTVTFDDIVLTLGGDTAPAADDNKDRGLEFRWHNGSAAKLGFFGYDDSASVFTFIPDATESLGAYSGTAGDVSFGAGTFASDVTFTGASYNAVWDSSDNALEFADNAKAVFGADSDLQIYHNGSRSVITDQGTGPLRISATNLEFKNADDSNLYANGVDGGAFNLYHAGNLKLATTSSGIDVTGTAVTDGVTVAGNILLQTEGNELQFNTSSTPVNKIYSDDTYTSNGLTISADNGVALQSTNNYLLLDDTGTNEMVLNVDGGERMRVTSTGIDVTGTVTADGLTVDGVFGFSTSVDGIINSPASLYVNFDSDNNSAGEAFVIGSNRTGASGGNEHLRVDASGNVGIGTSSPPSGTLHVKDTIATVYLQSDDGQAASVIFGDVSDETRGRIKYSSSDDMVFEVNNLSEAMRIDSNEKLLIGDSASHTSDLLQIETPASGGGHGIQIRRNDANGDQAIGTITFGNNTDTDLAQIKAKTDGDSNSGDSGALLFSTQVTSGSLTERMRIDSSGNVGIGTSSPSDKLHVGTSSGGTQLKIQSGSGTNNCVLHTDGTTDSWRTGMNLALTDGSYEFYDDVNNVDRMVIDSSGNVGIGTSSPSAKLDIFDSGAGNANSAAIELTNYDYGIGETGQSVSIEALVRNDGGGSSTTGKIVFGKDSDYSSAANRDGNIQFYTNQSNSVTEAMRIDSSGNVITGSTTANNADAVTLRQDGTVHANNLQVSNAGGSVGGTTPSIYSPVSSTLAISTGSTERMRIDSSGNLMVGDTSANARIYGAISSASLPAGAFVNTNAGTSGVGAIVTSVPSTANNTNCFHLKSTTQGVASYFLYGDGSSSFTSDERQKKNIVATRSGYLNDLKNLRVVDYHWNNQEDTEDKNIGLIAQEVEQVFPNLVVEHELEGAGVRKNLKGSDFTFILIKAIQEQQDLIESLTARIAALEGAN